MLPTMFDAPWSWLSDAESGGGLLNEFGSHVVDLLRWYFGEIVAVQGCAVRIKELRQYLPSPSRARRRHCPDEHLCRQRLRARYRHRQSSGRQRGT